MLQRTRLYRLPANTPRATGLSHGTAEQVYFLVRAALASVLHDLSARHQNVLFTQENDVLEWAEKNLVRPEHRLHRLQSAFLAAARPTGPNTM